MFVVGESGSIKEHKVHEVYTKNTTLCSLWFVVFVVFPRLCVKLVSGFFQRKLHRKCASFSQCTVSLDRASMRFHHRFHIAQSQSKPLYIMNVPGMCPVKPLENPFQCFAAHPDPVVFDTHNKIAGRGVRTDLYNR